MPAPAVFRAFLRLGLTSFGGPVAHLGYFRDEFVVRRRWLSDARYAEIVALCQFLPGPASSQTGMAIGLARAGWPGLVAAWAGFTLPSALLMLALAQGYLAFGATLGGGWLAGVKAAAVGVVAHALLGMRHLAAGPARAAIALAAAAAVLAVGTAWAQVLAIAGGAALGALAPSRSADPGGGPTASVGPAGAPTADAPPGAATLRASPRATTALLVAFVALLVGPPLVAAAGADLPGLDLFERFYRAGALVFGGGHVVLPLLQGGLVDAGLVDVRTFLAGYGFAQAVPGPMFTFATFLGAVAAGPAGAALATLAIFLPSALLVGAALGPWRALAARPRLRSAVAGANAAVVGLLAAAFVDPVLGAGATSRATGAIAAAAFVALAAFRAPAWLVVAAAALSGALVAG